MGVLLLYELLSICRQFRFPNMGILWYFLPFLGMLRMSGGESLAVLFMGLLYIQNDFLVDSYHRQIENNINAEQLLKKKMSFRENELQREMSRGLAEAENQMLEERAKLSQTLHDKLGHNINGSIYQLEAVKVVLKQEPDTAEKMIQAVIDELRSGMDEIRFILRRERPQKYKLALLQLEKLCEKCRQVKIDAGLETQGDLSVVPDRYLEIILDNAVEAVSNALKYAHCTKIEIKIIVMNRMLRCSIADNGVGCAQITDGMGLSGMRERMRSVNGIIDFYAETGFAINMLLPLKDS